MTTDKLWTIVLAAGDGTRLRGLSVDAEGASVPKQYWTIDGATTMLEWTLERAARLTPNHRIVPVVAAAPCCGAPAPTAAVCCDTAKKSGLFSKLKGLCKKSSSSCCE